MGGGFASQRTSPVRWGQGLLRYAAGLLIAFTAGYGYHAYVMANNAVQSAPIIVEAARSTESLEGTLASTHARKP